MEVQKDEMSDVGEAEDIPSDFFDDFSKDEFMNGLSVIDECWDDSGNRGSKGSREPRLRIDAEAVDSVSDLRELIGDKNDDDKPDHTSGRSPKPSRYKWLKPTEDENFIKPGSRRDPSKTNEAIKKDKEVKVQQFLAKSLESSDDLRPPGTELDDYYENHRKEPKSTRIDRDSSHDQVTRERSASPQRRSPRQRISPRQKRSPRSRFSPRQRSSPDRHNRSPLHFRLRPNFGKPYNNFYPHAAKRHFSPQRRSPIRRSPYRRSPARRSPVRRSPMRRSPVRRSPTKHSPIRRSARHSPGRRNSRSPRRQHRSRSRSPRRRQLRRSRSRSISRSRSVHRDNSFLYPTNSNVPGFPVGTLPYQPEVAQQYAPQLHQEYPGNVPGYPYSQAPAYGSGFPTPYNYGASQGAPVSMHAPVNPVPGPVVPISAPPMVPAPTASSMEKATPYDALAQLVAEGKISQQDYLKLTPNKGVVIPNMMDTKTRVTVLTRCSYALSKLDKLLVPNRLVINSQDFTSDDRYIAPKYCSPLKRQAVTEFGFTKESLTPAQQTKQLVDSIISTLGMDKMVSKYKNKMPKNIKDSAVQTTKSPCEVCEIRKSTKHHDVGTSTEPEYFTSTVHTQVVEQDLISSKSIFTPSGSVGEGAAISIAHLTPAQLVSQLAARAKTLKQPQEENSPHGQYNRRPPPNYDYDNRGQQYHSYNNYRY